MSHNYILVISIILVLLVFVPIVIYLFKDKDNFTYSKRADVERRLKNRAMRFLGNKNTPIYIIDNFLSSDECNGLIKNVKNLSNSTLTRYNGDENFRTSQTGYAENSSLQEEIDSKICNLLGMDKNLSETTQIQKYDVGQQFKEHNDAFYKGLDDSYLEERGQRSWTVMVYLNNVEKGGETEFTKLNKKIIPNVGQAVAWCSVDKDGNIDENTNHRGLPVISGTKYIITKWFH
jgi:prolyl 4-hydroxylase